MFFLKKTLILFFELIVQPPKVCLGDCMITQRPNQCFLKKKNSSLLGPTFEGAVRVLELLVVVNGGDGDLALGHVGVVVDVVVQHALGLHVGHEGLEELVEDVVGPLHLLLLGDAGLLQQVGLDVAPSQLNQSEVSNMIKQPMRGKYYDRANERQVL